MTGFDAVLVFLFVLGMLTAVVAIGDWLYARRHREVPAPAAREPECWLDDLDVDWQW